MIDAKSLAMFVAGLSGLRVVQDATDVIGWSGRALLVVLAAVVFVRVRRWWVRQHAGDGTAVAS